MSDYKKNLKKLEELKFELRNSLAEKIEVSWMEDNIDNIKAIDNRHKLSEKVLADIFRKKMDIFMDVTTFLSVFSKYRLEEVSKKSLLPKKEEETEEERLNRIQEERKKGETKKKHRVISYHLLIKNKKKALRFRHRKAFRLFKMLRGKKKFMKRTLHEMSNSSVDFYKIRQLYNKVLYDSSVKNFSLLKRGILFRRILKLQKLWKKSKSQSLNLRIKKIHRKMAPLRFLSLLKKKTRYSFLQKQKLNLEGIDKDVFYTVSRNKENSFDNLFFFVSYSPYNKKFMAELKKLFDFYTIAIKGTDLYDNKYKRKFFSNLDYYVRILDLKNFPQMNKEEIERLWAFLGCTKVEWFSTEKHEIKLVPQYNPWEFPLVLFLVIFFSYSTSVDGFWTFTLPDYGVLNMSQDELHEEGFNYYEKGNLGYQSYASGKFTEINPFDPHVWFDFLSFLKREYLVKIFYDFFSSWVFRNQYYFLSNFSSEFYKNYNMLYSKDVLYKAVDSSFTIFFKDLFGFYGYLYNTLCSIFFFITSFNISDFFLLNKNLFFVYLFIFLKIFFLSLSSFLGFFFSFTFVEKNIFFSFSFMFFDFFFSFFYVYFYKFFYINFSLNWGFINYLLMGFSEFIEVIYIFFFDFCFYNFSNLFFEKDILGEKAIDRTSNEVSFFSFINFFFVLFFYLLRHFFFC